MNEEHELAWLKREFNNWLFNRVVEMEHATWLPDILKVIREELDEQEDKFIDSLPAPEEFEEFGL